MQFSIFHRFILLLAVSFIGTSHANSQKIIGLDNWYNHEINAKTGKIYHYTWNDTLDSGFSQLGQIFTSRGARIVTIGEKPDNRILSGVNIYIIVDPDTTSENLTPNYITSDDIRTISGWVKKGGILVLMANDGPNCEFSHFNRLAGAFGFYFHPVTLNPVLNRNWEMGAETNLPYHPLFRGVNKIYMKEVSPISVSKKAKPVLVDGKSAYIAETKFGKGYVLAIGDPWLYNEYIDNHRLPTDFENFKAAENLCGFLLQMSR